MRPPRIAQRNYYNDLGFVRLSLYFLAFSLCCLPGPQSQERQEQAWQ